MDHLRSDPSGWDLLQTVLGEFALPMAVMDDSYQLIHVSPALENLADTVPRPEAARPSSAAASANAAPTWFVLRELLNQS
jgi:hypothetical protein